VISRVNDESIVSVEALVELLRAVVQSPGSFVEDTKLRAALQSQGSLAKFSDKSRHVIGTSINTLKRRSDKSVDGGWSAVDRLRRSAIAAIQGFEVRQRNSTKSTKVGLKQLVQECERKIEQLRVANFGLLCALQRLLSDIREVSSLSEAGARAKLCEESVARLRISVASNNPPFDRLKDYEKGALYQEASEP
jgi:hypothetical protein